MVQPDFQYVIRPGGDIPNPVGPTSTLGNAVVLGLRTSIKF
ncbi:MAG: carbohydrate porin [Rhodospirillales bacterium]|nr:carbohydrate porin [Rhodospirillales bacterium]